MYKKNLLLGTSIIIFLTLIKIIGGSGASFVGATWNASYIGNYSVGINDGAQFYLQDNGTSKILCGVSISDDKYRCLNVDNPLAPISLYNYTRSSGNASIDGAYAVEKIGNLVGILGQVDSTLAFFNQNANFSLTFISNWTNAANNTCSLEGAFWFKFDNRSGQIYAYGVGRTDDIFWVLNVTPVLTGGSPTCINWSYRAANPCSIDNSYSGDFDPIRKIVYSDSNVDSTVSKINVSNPLIPVCLANYTSTAPPFSLDGTMRIKLIPESNYTVMVATGRNDDNIWLANVSNGGIVGITGTNFTDATAPCSINNIRGLTVTDGGRTIITGVGSNGGSDSNGAITALNITGWNMMNCMGWINSTTDPGYYMNFTYWFTIDNRTNNTYTYITGVNTDIISFLNETRLYYPAGEEPPITDTCTCPITPSNWAINMPDHCNITSTCNIAGYNITFTNGTSSDYANISATITLHMPIINCTGWVKIDSDGWLNLTV